MEVELERPLELKEKDRHRQREMQLLKKKNTELASITRKLEEKVKSLEKVHNSRLLLQGSWAVLYTSNSHVFT